MRRSARAKQFRAANALFADASDQSCVRDYIQYLALRGYAAKTISRYSASVAHFTHWLAGQHLSVDDIDEDSIERFLSEHVSDCRCAARRTHVPADCGTALRHLSAILMAEGRCAPRQSLVPHLIVTELADFDRYLANVRGLAVATRSGRLRHLRDFLLAQFGTRSLQLDLLKPADVVDFMMSYTAGWAPASIKQTNNSLRSYFGFRAIQGDEVRSLVACLPPIVEWRLAGLPQLLSPQEIDQLLGAFDQQTATGKRDYAITRCLLDLGLRRAEVARLQLEDIDWRSGTLRIRGKATRVDMLPLPGTTARAIAAYLQDGRPATSRRELFVRHRPPVNGSAGPDIIRNAVRYAAKRCGLELRVRGTHILRHTLAGRLVQSGARFKEIADLLRHRSLDTTTIYAKVDLPALSHVALQWPGEKA